MGHLPRSGRHGRDPRPGLAAGHRAPAWRSAVLLGGLVALVSVLLPGASSAAAASHPASSLKSLLARARVLSNQISALSEQYDGLKIQLTQARDEERIARVSYRQDLVRLRAGQLTVGQMAAQSYMNGGLDSTLEMLTASTPQTLISRASLMQQLQQENGDRVKQFATAVAVAQRARETSVQQQARAARLATEMAARQREAQGKIRLLNSAVFAKAMAVFNQTGQYPNINLPTANTIGAQALRYALSKRGDPYVWGAAGPSAFDCSGLVMWAYAQVGISLPHYTGAQWNMGIHVSRSQLEPGDLVFFYAGISHVGLYIGNGLMVDAPDFGEVVQVQPVMWSVYVGAVRIVG